MMTFLSVLYNLYPQEIISDDSCFCVYVESVYKVRFDINFKSIFSYFVSNKMHSQSALRQILDSLSFYVPVLCIILAFTSAVIITLSVLSLDLSSLTSTNNIVRFAVIALNVYLLGFGMVASFSIRMMWSIGPNWWWLAILLNIVTISLHFLIDDDKMEENLTGWDKTQLNQVKWSMFGVGVFQIVITIVLSISFMGAVPMIKEFKHDIDIPENHSGRKKIFQVREDNPDLYTKKLSHNNKFDNVLMNNWRKGDRVTLLNDRHCYSNNCEGEVLFVQNDEFNSREPSDAWIQGNSLTDVEGFINKSTITIYSSINPNGVGLNPIRIHTRQNSRQSPWSMDTKLIITGEKGDFWSIRNPRLKTKNMMYIHKDDLDLSFLD